MKKLHFKHLIICLYSFFVLAGNTYACQVTPSLSYSSSNTCGLPHIVTARNTSSGTNNANSKYWWKINGILYGDTSIGYDTIKILLKNPGSNSIRIFVKDTSGCIDSSNTNINVTTNAKTILDQNLTYSHSPTWMNCLQFISDPDSFRINFESADTLRNLRIFWGDGTSDTGLGKISPNTVLTHMYNNLGVFPLKIVTTNGSCIDTVYGMVYNQRQPTAGIIGPTSGSNRGCAPHTLRIINNSYNISNNTTFLIDWGNGESITTPYTSFQDTFFHVYKKGVCAGIIKITATNVCGSSFSTWNPIDISEKDKAKWEVTTTCNPTTNHVFLNQSSDRYCLFPDIKEYFWDFGDGTTVGWINSKASQNHIYAKEGNYTVKLIVRTACGNDTFIGSVGVQYNPIAEFTYNSDRSCKPLAALLVDTTAVGSNYTRKWTIKEGSITKTSTDSIINHTFTTPGTHSISLGVSNACGSSTKTKYFIVNDKPKAQFATINSGCIPVQVSYSNTSTSYFSNASYTWDFGDSTSSNLKNPGSKTYSKAGTYIVKLIVKDSCGTDTFKQTFIAYGLPVAIIKTDSSACTFDSIAFINSSLNSSVFYWNFGDNTSKTVNSTDTVKHLYSSASSYTISLISASVAGCRDTVTKTLIIKPGAKAQFDLNNNYSCTPALFKFTNKSVYCKDYRWYANGNLISSVAQLNDTLIQSDSTIIRIKLKVTSASSCQDDSIENVFFTPKNPIASVNYPDSGCGILKVNFNNTSLHATKYQWILGNGNISTIANPVALYPGSQKQDSFYFPTLIAENWASCKDTANLSIKVFPAPKAQFQFNQSSGCGPHNVQFTNSSYSSNSYPNSSLKYRWDFGSVYTSTKKDTSFTFNPSNTKDSFNTVILNVASLNGCSDTESLVVRVYPIPLVSFSPTKLSGCEILPVNFTNLSSPKDTGTISSMRFIWNSGNGTTATTKNFSGLYKASLYGDTIYTVKLIGISEHNCIDSNTATITVHPQPIAIFNTNLNSACSPFNVVTINQSISKDGLPLSHKWNFGNLYQSNSIIDSTVYINTSDNDLNHTIQYIAISAYGCKDTAVKTITTRPQPRAFFHIPKSAFCAPAIVALKDSSINAISYEWGTDILNSGNATDSIILNGIQLFDTTYVVSHTVSSIYGCKSEPVYKSVVVYGRPISDFLLNEDSTCMRDNIGFTNNSLGSVRYVWNFGDNSSSTLINPKHSFMVPAQKGDSTFSVSLESSSSRGCKDTSYKSVYTVNVPLDTILADKIAGCTDLEVQLKQKSKRFGTATWNFGDNSNTETADSVKHTYYNYFGNNPVQNTVSLYRKRFNCLDTSKIQILVYPTPDAAFKVQRNDPCDAGIYQLVNQSLNFSSSKWYIDSVNLFNGNSFSTLLPGVPDKDTLYHVELVVGNQYSCYDTISQIVKAKRKMLVAFTNDSSHACENEAIQFTNQSKNVSRNFWKFSDGTASNDVNPYYTFNNYGSFKVVLYGFDKDGCIDSSRGNTLITITEKPGIHFTYLPAAPQLPNAIVNFTSNPIIQSVNENDLVYDWNFGDNTYPTSNYSIKDPTHTYFIAGLMPVTLKVRNKQCATEITKIIFIEEPKPIADFTADSIEGCVPFRVHFKNNSLYADSYRWIFGDGSPDSYEFEPDHLYEYSGSWNVTLIASGKGGSGTLQKKFMITTYPLPTVEFYTNKIFMSLPNAIFNMTNMSNSVYNYWEVSDSNGNVFINSDKRDPSFTIDRTGNFNIQLIGVNSYGCRDTLMKPSYISTLGPGYVYVPNAFSPNNNDKNEGFAPSLYNVKDRNFKFQVFNRWGEMVFSTDDINAIWDGTFKGELCEQDVYVWTVNGEFYNSDLFSFKGTVTLLR